MNARAKLVFLVHTGFALLALTSLNTSARTVCNVKGACWRVPDDYVYPHALRRSVHPAGWRWREWDHYVWKEHEGRGYRHGGEWRTL